jgi:hypothetical protein
MKDYNKAFDNRIRRYGLSRKDFTEDEIRQGIEELKANDNHNMQTLYEDGVLEHSRLTVMGELKKMNLKDFNG